MAYNLESFTISQGPNPCENFELNIVVSKLDTDSDLLDLSLVPLGAMVGETFAYPQDFINSSETLDGGRTFYDLTLIKTRESASTFTFKFGTVAGTATGFGGNKLPFRFLLENVEIDRTSKTSVTVTPILTKTSGEIVTQEEITFAQILSSLDNITFSSFKLTDVSEGTYTLYVKDQFGCTKTFVFKVRNPFLFVSLLNSVRFAQRNELRRNPDNQLSYEETTDTNYQSWFNKLPVGDTIRLQYQSNYKINKAFLLRDDGSFGEITVDRITNNVGKKDIRDGLLSYDGTTATVKYPINGTIYNSEGTAIGTNDLGGDVLEENEIGSFIFIEGRGGFEIIDIIQEGDFELMVINYEGTLLTDQPVIVTTEYDNFQFDYYEFSFTLDLAGCYQIAICDDNSFDEQDPLSTVKYLSERILVTEDLDMNHKIEWRNNENNQIAWSTGIVSKIYIPYVMPPSYQAEDENEIYMTDTSQEMLESESFENYRFNFDLIPTAIVRQLQFAFGSSDLSIDDIQYLRKETPEIESQDGSNLYLMTPVLSRVTNYNSNSAKGVRENSEGLTDITGILKLN